MQLFQRTWKAIIPFIHTRCIMSERRTIENFLSEIDEDLVQYATNLRKHGFTSNKSMKHWVEADFRLINMQVPEGHKRMIMNAVSRMSSPQSNKTKRKTTPTVGESPESKSHCAESSMTHGVRTIPRNRRTDAFPRRRLNKEMIRFNPGFNMLEPEEVTDSENEDDIRDEPDDELDDTFVKSVDRTKTAKSVISPVERYIKSKEAEIRVTSIEIEEKRQELEHTIEQIENASSIMGKTGQKCSNCHQRNHTVRSCKGNKCESSLLCGLLTKHPDEKKQFDEKKRAVAAKEASLKKLQQELTSRQNSFYRVTNSVNMNIEDMLIQEYPEDYVIDGTRNWLKLQKDVALVKKNIRSSSDISRTKIRSILSTNAELSLPPRVDSLFDDKPEKTAMQCKLESYGMNFPIRAKSKTKKCESVMAFSTYLQPKCADEEIEQLRMATKLSLVTKEPRAVDDVMNTGETQGETYGMISVEKTNEYSNEEAANILLGMRCGPGLE